MIYQDKSDHKTDTNIIYKYQCYACGTIYEYNHLAHIISKDENCILCGAEINKNMIIGSSNE